MTSCGAEGTVCVCVCVCDRLRKKRMRSIAEEEGATENSTVIISFSRIHIFSVHPNVLLLKTEPMLEPVVLQLPLTVTIRA